MQVFSKRILSVLLVISIVLSLLGSFAVNSFAATYMGDVTNDGKLSSDDALLVLQAATGMKTLTSAQVEIGDLSGDGKVNSSDALLILQTVTGLIPLKEKTESETGVPFEGVVTADPSLRLRSGAGTSYSKVADIPLGTVLTITKISNNWGQTTYNGKSGWVSLEYIRAVETVSGTFTIVCYGYGHGVGMSQYGAKKYAEDGWTYDKILLHYYYSDKTKIEKDEEEELPETVKYGSEELDLKTYIAGSVRAEIGDSWHIEAIKAQMVAIYTYAKYYGFNVSASTHAYKSDYKYEGTKIETAMNEVLGEYISYNDKAILSVYCSSMGGKNTSAKNAWGGSDVPYLRGGRTSPESESVMKKTYTFTAEEIRALVQQNLGVVLNDSPETWFADIVHDKSISNSVGYITSMNVGGKTVKGENARIKIFTYSKMRSHCISIKYNA